MNDREDFEEAASRLGYNLTMAEHETGEYHYRVTQDAWDMWQEAKDQAARAQGVEAEGRVAIPRDVAEAKGMYLVGYSWLKHNAPDELTDAANGKPKS